jgi:hypothetical protein
LAIKTKIIENMVISDIVCSISFSKPTPELIDVYEKIPKKIGIKIKTKFDLRKIFLK